MDASDGLDSVVMVASLPVVHANLDAPHPQLQQNSEGDTERIQVQGQTAVSQQSSCQHVWHTQVALAGGGDIQWASEQGWCWSWLGNLIDG